MKFILFMIAWAAPGEVDFDKNASLHTETFPTEQACITRLKEIASQNRPKGWIAGCEAISTLLNKG